MTADEVKFDLLRNALYHSSRKRWLQFVSRLLNFVVIIAGAGALSDILPASVLPAVKAGCAAVTLLAGTLQLVWDFAGQAWTHDALQRRYWTLISEMEALGADVESEVSHLRAEMTKIFADEPPLMRAADAVAYNDAVDALGFGRRLEISSLQAALKHVCAFERASFPYAPAE